MAANLKIMTPHVYSYSIVLFIYEYNIITKVLWQTCRRQISLGWCTWRLGREIWNILVHQFGLMREMCDEDPGVKKQKIKKKLTVKRVSLTVLTPLASPSFWNTFSFCESK